MTSCLLCRQQARILQSHVLPSFVFKSMKNRSATGHIRYSDNPNKRVQDGVKRDWLCSKCEALFSGWEREFANRVFHPWLNGSLKTRYDDWMLKFCVSVSWRVLNHCHGLNPATRYTEEQKALLIDAELTWRKFLLGELPHPGKFRQQFVIFDVIEDTTVRDLPTNINRFMTGAIAMDIVGSGRSLFAWSKLGRFQIFGTIQEGPDKFEGTQVHVREGVLKPRQFVLPAGLLDLYREKAAHAQNAMASISDQQFAKIDDAVMSDIDRMIASDNFAAMRADAEMFGEGVIVRSRGSSDG